MPIPDFNHNHVLPPHLGNPTEYSHLSPYSCTIMELCLKFSTSANRIEILKKFIQFRQRLHSMDILYGFQWLDGSFLENIELSEGRPPRDLDLVTFFGGVSKSDLSIIQASFPEFSDPILSKANYFLDHYAVDYSFKPDATVELTRYWIQLFSHNRLGVWKGILKLPLNTPIEDKAALDYLNSIKL